MSCRSGRRVGGGRPCCTRVRETHSRAQSSTESSSSRFLRLWYKSVCVHVVSVQQDRPVCRKPVSAVIPLRYKITAMCWACFVVQSLLCLVFERNYYPLSCTSTLHPCP